MSQKLLRQEENTRSGLLLPVGGGKGGIGKSLLTMNLGLNLAGRGRRVVLADLDLGASNLHTLLGQKNLRPGLGRLLVDKKLGVPELVYPTPWPNLSYIPGDNQTPGAANPLTTQKLKIIRGLRSVRADALICDLGAGAHSMILDFFLISPRGLVLFTPELPSLLNAFTFLRQSLYTALLRLLNDNSYAKQILRDYRSSPLGPESWSVERLMEEMNRLSPESNQLIEEFLDWWRPGLVISQVGAPVELKAMSQLTELVNKKLSVKAVKLACLPQDDQLTAAVRSRRPITTAAPDCPYLQAVDYLAHRIGDWADADVEDLAGQAAGWLDKPSAAPPDLAEERKTDDLLAELAPVVDDLARAVEAARNSGAQALTEGLEAVLRNHLARLARQDLEPIQSLGQPFDPRIHQAVSTSADSDAAKGTIIAETAMGFVRRGRLVRPAQVVVAE